MDHAESVAKCVLEGVLHGRMEYQHIQSHGEYDFELHYNGTTAAVEVTASVDRKQREIVAAIRDENGSSIPATKCKNDWVIFAARGARIPNIRKAADDCLFGLEQAGITEFSWVRDWNRPCVQQICRDLKVTSGRIIRTGVHPVIRILPPAGGGAVGASIAIEAGEKEAWKEDNRKKLGAAKAPERHLVVYIEPLNGLPWVALTDFQPTPVLPKLPPEITDIWLLGHGKETNEFVVWYAGRERHWSSLRM